jgi:hypothetical protein
MEEHHIALPKLYGAPAYARPPRVAPISPRPLNMDDLPIEAVQSDDERALVASLPPGADDVIGARDRTGRLAAGNATADSMLEPRPLSLRALAGRILGQADN